MKTIQPPELAQVLPLIRYKVDDALSGTKFQPNSLEELPKNSTIVVMNTGGKEVAVVAHSYLGLKLDEEEAKSLAHEFIIDLEHEAPAKILRLFQHLPITEYDKARGRIESLMTKQAELSFLVGICQNRETNSL